jgi:hypothetical protein
MFLGLLALIFFIIKNDEVLLLLVLFFYTSGLNRYNLVTSGAERWVRVAYAKDIFNLTNELGLQALNYFFMGTAVFCVAYFIFGMFRKPPEKFKDDQLSLKGFLTVFQIRIIVLFIIILIINFYAKRYFVLSYVAGGGGVAFGGSYFVLFGFALGGVIPLIFLVFKNYELKDQFLLKVFFGFVIGLAATLTYSSSGRFQFLSWSITAGIIFVGDKNPFYKMRIYLVGGLLLSLAFGLAGVKRRTDVSQMSWFQKFSLAWERNKSTEDATMLDGFMMVLQVYPQHLNYHYGSEHLEILYRPIPRSVWPGKPLGGYANKLGLNDNMGGGSVGISQSLYGTFYGEGGVYGIVIFCIIYAFFLDRLMVSSVRYNSDIRHLIKGTSIAAMVPLLRGGDLPGIYAFIGMTFWPVIFFISTYKKFLPKYFYNRYLEMRRMHEEQIYRQKNQQTTLV